ncbi:MAG: PDZ domain-containing protein [Betaproteobacteria bacterium]|nr:MAG: PDZ domain-containing protein [Betaproteobacteria bacterium]
MKSRVALTLVCLLAACATAEKQPAKEQPEPPPQPSTPGIPFAGVWLAAPEPAEEQKADGARVLGVVAGPAAVAGLRANDLIVRIDNIEVDAARANAIISSALPGDRLVLDVVRNNEPMTLTMIIDSSERWLTPSSFTAGIPFAATGLSGPALQSDPVMPQILAAAPELEPIAVRMDRMFAELAQDDTGYHKLPLIRSAMLNPATMNRWRDDLTETLRPFELERSTVVEVMCDTLALACTGHTRPSTTNPVSLQQFAETINDANDQVRSLFDAARIDRATAYADLHYLMRTTAADRTLIGQPEAHRGIRAMQLSMRVDLSALLDTAGRVVSNSEQLPEASGASRQPPAELKGIVDGTIVDYKKIDDGYVVIGGTGTNRYDMNQLYAVIDAGGNDSYHWGDAVALETQTVVDLKGNDSYHAKAGGPGAGWLGVAVLIDVAGNDQYTSDLGGCGAGALGFGFLFDDSGNDTYRCAAWSAGSAIYGGGALVDQGEQTDVYGSQVFSQGVGGPRAIGILIDAGGGDVYRANGAVRSAYDTPGSFMAFSQGVGVGIRPYDFGGVGMLLDFAGDDRYEGGEFAQGGGYLWGIGLLRDESGNDLYYGDRYAQGFAAHQAFGMLTDLSGDDIYWGKSAATQGAAWDQSIAVLFDAEGDDVYRAHSLSQGAAAQQSRAVLHDAEGDDWYWSSARDTQGAAGSNNYHFRAEDPVYSLGVLLDERGEDRFSTGVDNGETRLRIRTGTVDGRGVAGVVVDLR